MRPEVLLVFTAIGSSAALGATPLSLPSPPASAYADTESSVTHAFTGWDDLTRFFTLSLEVETNSNTCVQVALGSDRNADNNLAPEETDLIVGFDCGTWFIRNEKSTTHETFAVETDSSLCSRRFNLKPYFDPAWNTAKVTTRGTTNVHAVIFAEFKNNPFRLVLR